jgi:phospholipase/carboxylesterase
MVMRAWYDIRAADLTQREDEAGLDASAAIVNALVAQETARGIPADRIVLAGFSQGGAIVLHAGLRYPEPLAGILALSCYLPVPHRLPGERQARNMHVPILMAHGTWDPIVPIATGRASARTLSGLGYDVEFREYPMPHAVCPEEVEDIAAWLRLRLHMGTPQRAP